MKDVTSEKHKLITIGFRNQLSRHGGLNYLIHPRMSVADSMNLANLKWICPLRWNMHPIERDDALNILNIYNRSQYKLL
jgi:hypothetical protein